MPRLSKFTREHFRALLAIYIITLVFAFLFFAVLIVSDGDSKELLFMVVGAVLGIPGVILGFYFASSFNPNKNNSNQPPEL